MGAIASQITSLTIVYSTVYSDADQRKHQSAASPAFVRGIHRSPVNSPHKWPVTRKMFPFDDVFMCARFIVKEVWQIKINHICIQQWDHICKWVKLVAARPQQHNQTACIIHGVYCNDKMLKLKWIMDWQIMGSHVVNHWPKYISEII